MKTDEQHLSPAHIQFYKGRWFWMIVFGIFFIFSTVLFTYALSNTGSSHQQTLYDIYTYLTIAYGATFIQFVIFGKFASQIGATVYLLLSIYFLYMTFRHKLVNVLFPLLYTVLYLSGIITSILLIGGYS